MRSAVVPILRRKKSSRNRTLRCGGDEIAALRRRLTVINRPVLASEIAGKIICQDAFDAARHFPRSFVDLLILDPPYNMSKNYHGHSFVVKKKDEYAEWFERIIMSVSPALRPSAAVYVCADWKTSVIVAPILERHFVVKNRITWEREKGRGAKSNWKNNTEDIWFCTLGDDCFFNVDAVKIKRKVVAPYRENGAPKDWLPENGGNFRLTYPSNIWTDISVPFWSMPENTDHPTQKPEKLFAKLMLANTRPGDMVLDPFLGSGTAAVVAKKLCRRFVGVEINEEYCCWAQKRLLRTSPGDPIQGYTDGVFWERNTHVQQLAAERTRKP